MSRAECVQGWVNVVLQNGEQTEAYVFGSLELRGASRAETDEAIGALLDIGKIRSTLIADRNRMTHSRDFGAVRHYPALAPA